MPRTSKSRANSLFTASAKADEQVLASAERERQVRADLTAKLREQRLAKEESDRIAAERDKPAKRKKAARVRTAQSN